MTGEPTLTQLVAALRAEQRQRWLGGECVFAEAYLAKHPALRSDADRALELIYNEVLVREELGELPQPEEYERRFPQWAVQLRRLFEVHRDLELSDLSEPPERTSPRAGTGLPANRPAIAGYQVLGELGRGGMGVVYKAWQSRADRVVALKMLLPGAQATPHDLARFRDEAKKLARLSHPNIVPIYEVGDQDGLPFFSMEFVAGGSLADRLRDTPLPARAAARLVEPLAHAVDFVHQAGIAHRDLKPANVLLAEIRDQRSEVSGAGSGGRRSATDLCSLISDLYVPKITDFGLAKRLDAGRGQTPTGALPGTPSYMAPEQARSWGNAVGPAADVYGLGAILYELLTGRPPFRGTTLLDTLEQVLHDEPVPPSRLQPKVPRDLETICLKCLEKEPKKRYATALDLAEDLRRFLAGEPIRARPGSAWGRAVKWAKRRPAAAALVGLSVLIVAGLTAGGWIYAGGREIAEEERRQKRAAQEEVEHQRQIAERERTSAEGERELRRELQAANQALAANGRKLEVKEYVSYIRLVALQMSTGNLGGAEECLGICSEGLRDFEWGYLQRLRHLDLRTLSAEADGVWPISRADRRVAFSPDGRHVVSAGSYFDEGRQQVLGAVKVWETATGKAHTLGEHAGQVIAVAFSPNGRYLASANSDGAVKVWEWPTGREAHTFQGHAGGVTCLAFSPDGRRLASTGTEGTARVWDTIDAREPLVIPIGAGPVWSVAFSPDGRLLATAGGKEVKVWKAESGEAVHTLPHAGQVRSVAFSTNGRHLASASEDGTVKLWDAPTGGEVASLRGSRPGVVSGLAFSPDGRHLAAAHDRVVSVWSVATGQEVLALRGHTNSVLSVTYSPDGRLLASAGLDRTVKVWDATASREVLTLKDRSTGPVHGVAFSPKAQLLASVGADNGVHVWDVAIGRMVRVLKGHTLAVRAAAFSPGDGRYLATAGDDGKVNFWNMETGELVLTCNGGNSGPVRGVAFSPDGRRLASAGDDRRVRIWDAPPGKGQEVRALEGHTGRVACVVFSPNGELLASAGESPDGNGQLSGEVIVWNAKTGAKVLSFREHTRPVTCVAFSPDGQRLASAGLDHTVKVWDATTAKGLLTLQGHAGTVTGVVFSLNGRRLASAGIDGTVKLWELVLGQEVFTLQGHTGPLTGLAFSPDGQRLASTGHDRTIKVWDARPLTPDVQQEREALSLVEFVFAKSPAKADAIKAIQDNPTVSDAVKRIAQALAERFPE